MKGKLKECAKGTGRDCDQKLHRLSILARDFLEKPLLGDAIAKDPQKMKALLWDNLFDRNINPNDPDWDGETEQESAQMIMDLHAFLTKSFWFPFKEMLRGRPQEITDTSGIPEEYRILMATSDCPQVGFLNIKMPETPVVLRCSFEGKKIHFFRSSFDALRQLIDLLQGLPLDRLRFCGNEKCGAFIVQTTGHKKIYCSPQCQSKKYQAVWREKSPEEFKEYHRKNYHIKKDRKKKKR